eukprot:4030759-Prymnesium_polylepis.2
MCAVGVGACAWRGPRRRGARVRAVLWGGELELKGDTERDALVSREFERARLTEGDPDVAPAGELALDGEAAERSSNDDHVLL